MPTKTVKSPKPNALTFEDDFEKMVHDELVQPTIKTLKQVYKKCLRPRESITLEKHVYHHAYHGEGRMFIIRLWTKGGRDRRNGHDKVSVEFKYSAYARNGQGSVAIRNRQSSGRHRYFNNKSGSWPVEAIASACIDAARSIKRQARVIERKSEIDEIDQRLREVERQLKELGISTHFYVTDQWDHEADDVEIEVSCEFYKLDVHDLIHLSSQIQKLSPEECAFINEHLSLEIKMYKNGAKDPKREPHYGRGGNQEDKKRLTAEQAELMAKLLLTKDISKGE